MLQKTIKHCHMLQLIYGSSVKVRLIYAVHCYLSIMQYSLPKEDLHIGEISSTTKANIVLSKVILFISCRKKKRPQKEDISVQYVKASMDAYTFVATVFLFYFLLLNFVIIFRDVLRTLSNI